MSLLSDLRGAVRLLADAVTGTTDVVEAAHAAVTRRRKVGDRKRGIAGFVYRMIRAITRGAARAADGGLAVAERVRPDALDGARGEIREAAVAALNGAFGDTLARTGNELATATQIRYDGRPVDTGAVADPSETVLVFVHGLCMHDGQWGDDAHDPGAVLAEALGASRLGLRYNSGRHVSDNGAEAAEALEAVVRAWPVPVRRIVVVAHSMGGLVMRSALGHAVDAGHGWPSKNVSLVCLGTPHHGSPLERVGNVVDTLLGATRWTAPYAALGQARSAGVTDLRFGSVAEADWVGLDRFARGPDHREPLPLPDGVAVYLVAATLGDGKNGVRDRTVGDGLVPLDSALGRHPDPALALAVPAERQYILPGTSHFDLIRDPEVTARLLAWLVPSGAGPRRPPA